MSTAPLPLSELVNISVTVSPAAPSPNGFNQGLIIDNSTALGTKRLEQFAAANYATAMLTAGFTNTSPAYLAATAYFSARTQPGFVWVGQQVASAISTLIPHSGSAGTGYVVGDIVEVTQSGASGGFATVTAVNAGAVTTLTVGSGVPGTQGNGYSVASALPTTGGSGTGLEVDITAIGESLLQAAQACRAASNAWYGLMVCGAVDADNLAIAAWADPQWQTTRFYPWTNDVAVLNGVANNLFLQLQADKYKVLPIYSTTQGGLYPNDIYAAAALMGCEMGLNTGLAGSFFSCAYKSLPGVAPEPLTVQQYNNVTGTGGAAFYGNVYTAFGPYTFLQPGFMSSGDPSYLWLYLAMLVQTMQYNVLNVLQAQPVVPQTNPGEGLLIQAVEQACATMASIGFLASGTWEGPTVLNLAAGQTLPDGYLVQAQSYAKQAASDRAAGKAMPIYVAITTAGAVQSLLIGVNVVL